MIGRRVFGAVVRRRLDNFRLCGATKRTHRLFSVDGGYGDDEHDGQDERLSFSYDRDDGVVTVRRRDDDGGGATRRYTTVIGLEVHARLSAPTKMFSDSSAVSSDAPPNTSVSPFDAAAPGSMPSLSYEAVRAAVLSCAVLGCPVETVSRFERKHYSYPDLPHGFQITQRRWPLSRGHVGDDRFDGVVGVERVQLEIDTGKTTMFADHDHNNNNNNNNNNTSLVDLNRAGRALIEIVFRPDLRSAARAAEVVGRLRSALRFAGTCDGRMEDGSLRCDLNVSLAPYDNNDDEAVVVARRSDVDVDVDDPFAASLPPGTGRRVEVKNLNSFRQIVVAAEYEALRQAREVEAGRTVEQETRAFDARAGRTVRARGKGGNVDYRFLLEPNLPPLVLPRDANDARSLGPHLSSLRDGETSADIVASLPETADRARERVANEYGASDRAAEVVATDPESLSLFERSVDEAWADLTSTTTTTSDGRDHGISRRDAAFAVGNWIANDLLSIAKESFVDDERRDVTVGAHRRVSPRELGQLAAMVLDGTVSKRAAKKILRLFWFRANDDDVRARESPRELARRKGWVQITDDAELRRLCRSALDKHPEESRSYREGNDRKRTKLEKFLVGKVLEESNGNAHPVKARTVLKTVLDEDTKHDAENDNER